MKIHSKVFVIFEVFTITLICSLIGILFIKILFITKNEAEKSSNESSEETIITSITDDLSESEETLADVSDERTREITETTVEETTFEEESEITTETTEVVEETTEEEISDSVVFSKYSTSYSKNSEEVVVLAKCVRGEAGALKSDTEKAAVIWCVLNRVDSELRYMPDDIISVVTQAYQFTGYRENNEVREDLVELVLDVLGRWEAEHRGEENVGRILPKEYMWFYGKTARNTFRDAYKKEEANYWDWSLPSPYED